MLNKAFIPFFMVFITIQLLSCQSEEQIHKQYLTNDSTKYWDLYERWEWDLIIAKKPVKVTGVDKIRTCWAFSKNGQWIDYAVHKTGKLRDSNLLTGDSFHSNNWILTGDTLLTGLGAYLIIKCTKDTLELAYLLEPKYIFKLRASENQDKQLCPNYECQ